jgi:hypothetical protein
MKENFEKYALTFFAVYIFVLFFASLAKANNDTNIVRYYIEKCGDTAKQVCWCLTGQKGYQLTYQTTDECHVTETDDSLATLSWQMTKTSQKFSMKSIRQENAILIDGEDEGKIIQKHIEIDDTPWFQATSLSLRNFILSNRTEIEFLTLIPQVYDVYKMKATKSGTEKLVIHNQTIETVRVEMKLAGILGSIWKGHYWYRARDGAFMRFTGPANIAGTEQMVVSFTGRETIRRTDMGLSNLKPEPRAQSLF